MHETFLSFDFDSYKHGDCDELLRLWRGKCYVMYLNGNGSVESLDCVHLIRDTVLLYWTVKFEAGKFLHNRQPLTRLNGVTIQKVVT